MVDITFRGAGAWGSGKGSRLTILEGDTNWWNLKEAVEAFVAADLRDIADISIVGDQLTFTMSDSTFIGPLTIPTAMLNPRGEWVASTVYAVNDVVTHQGTVYFVTYPHTAAGTFDPGATSGPGQDWYAEQIPVTPFPGFEEWRLEEAGSGAASPAEGDIMVYRSGVWDVEPPTSTIPTFEELRADTATSGSDSPVIDDGLRWDGISWVPVPFDFENLRLELAGSDTPAVGEIMRWDGSAWVAEGTSVTITNAATSLSLTTAHPHRYIRFTNVLGCTVTVPSNASQAIAVDSEIHLRQTTAGTVTVTPAGGVTVNVPDGFQSMLQGQHATATLKKVGTNEWDLMGLLEAVT